MSASQDALVAQSSISTSVEPSLLLISFARASTLALLRANSNSLLFPFERFFEIAAPMLPDAPMTAMVCFVFIFSPFDNTKLQPHIARFHYVRVRNGLAFRQ